MTIVESIQDILAHVCDPEIPTVSIVDLGMVESVMVDGQRVTVGLMPTFVGCPAQSVIERQVRERLGAQYPDYEIDVHFSLLVPWTSARITPTGRKALEAFGIAPPGRHLDDVACPFCHDSKPVMQNLFASTSCRSLYYCSQCHNPFEAFKP